MLHHCLEHSTDFQLKRGSNTKFLTCAFSVSLTTPCYLTFLTFFHPYQPPRTLRSLDTSLLSVSRFCLETFGQRSFCFLPHCLEFLTFISQKNSVFFNFQKEAKNSSVRKASQLIFASVFFCVCRSVRVCVCVGDTLFMGMAAGIMYTML